MMPIEVSPIYLGAKRFLPAWLLPSPFKTGDQVTFDRFDADVSDFPRWGIDSKNRIGDVQYGVVPETVLTFKSWTRGKVVDGKLIPSRFGKLFGIFDAEKLADLSSYKKDDNSGENRPTVFHGPSDEGNDPLGNAIDDALALPDDSVFLDESVYDVGDRRNRDAFAAQLGQFSNKREVPGADTHGEIEYSGELQLDKGGSVGLVNVNNLFVAEDMIIARMISTRRSARRDGASDSPQTQYFFGMDSAKTVAGAHTVRFPNNTVGDADSEAA